MFNAFLDYFVSGVLETFNQALFRTNLRSTFNMLACNSFQVSKFSMVCTASNVFLSNHVDTIDNTPVADLLFPFQGQAIMLWSAHNFFHSQQLLDQTQFF